MASRVIDSGCRGIPQAGQVQKEGAAGNIATSDVSRLHFAADVGCAFVRIPENVRQTYSISLNFPVSDTVAFSSIRAMTDSCLVQAF
jgi:hypothetical protein